MIPPHNPPRTAKIRRVVADEYDDLNLDFTPEHSPVVKQTPVAQVVEAAPNLDSYDFEGEGFQGQAVDTFNQPPLRVAPANVLTDDPWETPEQTLDPLPKIPTTTARIGHNPRLGFSPWENLDEGSWWDKFKYGAGRGLEWGINPPSTENSPVAGFKGHYSKSVLERAPEIFYEELPTEGKVGFAAGRVAADVLGHGTRHYLWNVQPEDFTNTYGRQHLKDSPRLAMLAGSYGASVALGIGSGNYNPLNIAEGGRTAGYSAVNADPEDPTQSTTPVSEFLIDRGMFGRKGKLLPWEQFKQERPDVSYEEYSDYKDYLFNKDDNLLRSLTLGLAKGTLDGINGPELNVMGYGVTPLGAAAAMGTLAVAKHYAGRIGNLVR